MADEVIILPKELIDKFRTALNLEFGYIWGTAGVMWTAQKQELLEKTTDADRAVSRKYGSKWIGHMVADCSGLFTWAFRELGGYMYHGSNTMWNKYCSKKGELRGGKRTDGLELQPGTAVFTYNKSKDNRGHVGLYVGDGLVIEAEGTKAGVITSKVTKSKWVEWGELKGVKYGDDTPVPSGNKPTLRRGDKGEYVRLAQTELFEKGYDLGSCGIDGDFGKATEKAVKEFQKNNGLTVDGVIGNLTWEALDAPTVLYTVTIPHLSKTYADELVSKYLGAIMTEERG